MHKANQISIKIHNKINAVHKKLITKRKHSDKQSGFVQLQADKS